MAKKKDNDGLIWGIILVSIGAVFFIQQFFDLSIFSWIWQLWPLVFVIWGLVVIKNSVGKTK